MKKLLTIFILFLSFRQTFSQAENNIELFRNQILPQYNMFFSQAEIADNGHLNLIALNNYIGINQDKKKEILLKISKAWHDSLFIVSYLSKREIWSTANKDGSIILIDTYDINSITE